MKMRLLVLFAVALGLAPGTWVRSETTKRDYAAPLNAVAIDAPTQLPDGLTLTGLWHLKTQNDHGGGYSALIRLPNGDLLAGSDRGRLLQIPLANGEPVPSQAYFSFMIGASDTLRQLVDLEALTVDQDSNTIWAAYESRNAIDRIVDLQSVERRMPPEIRRLPFNSGPETLLRLSDGRFLLLGEGPERRGLPDRPGFLFDRDPVDPDAQSTAFRFVTPKRYSPVDATLLPDGDVLILLRRVQYRFPPKFDVALMRADPSTIVAGEEWSGELVGKLDIEVLHENFEGLTYIRDSSGEGEAGSVYLIADDNLSVFQRSLFARISWPPAQPQQAADSANEKAPEQARTP